LNKNRVAFVVLCLGATLVPMRAEASGVIRGTVQELETGRFIRDALISIPEFGIRAQTDSIGGYVLRGVLPGLRKVHASASFRLAWTGDVSVADGDTAQFDIKMKRVPVQGGLAGSVTADDGKRPVPHAVVLFGTPPIEGRADEQGFFNSPGVDPGPCKMKAGGLGFDAVDFALPIVEGRTTLFTIDLGRSLLEGGPKKRRPTPKPSKNPAADTLSMFRFLVRDRLPSAPAGPSRRVPTEILVWNEASKPVRKLGEWRLYPGPYMVTWDGRDSTGKAVSMGGYKLHLCLDNDWADGEELLHR
jgi:hypothetical protein